MLDDDQQQPAIRGLAAHSQRRALGRAALALAVVAQAVAGDGKKDWATIGHDPANTRNQPFEHKIKPANVDRLAPKWVATTTGDVSATPAVVGRSRVLRGLRRHALEARRRDRRGDLVALRCRTTPGIAGDYARTSPSLAGNTLVVGVIRAQPRLRPEHARHRREDRRAALEDADPPGPARRS